MLFNVPEDPYRFKEQRELYKQRYPEVSEWEIDKNIGLIILGLGLYVQSFISGFRDRVSMRTRPAKYSVEPMDSALYPDYLPPQKGSCDSTGLFVTRYHHALHNLGFEYPPLCVVFTPIIKERSSYVIPWCRFPYLGDKILTTKSFSSEPNMDQIYVYQIYEVIRTS